MLRPQGTGIPCTKRVSHTGYHARGNGEGEVIWADSIIEPNQSTQQIMILKDKNTRDHSAWTIENEACMYPTQDTPRMATARMKQKNQTQISTKSRKK